MSPLYGGVHWALMVVVICAPRLRHRLRGDDAGGGKGDAHAEICPAELDGEVAGVIAVIADMGRECGWLAGNRRVGSYAISDSA